MKHKSLIAVWAVFVIAFSMASCVQEEGALIPAVSLFADASSTSIGEDVELALQLPTQLALGIGAYEALTPAPFPLGAAVRRAFYTSSKPDVAGVDENGVITALTMGECTVTTRYVVFYAGETHLLVAQTGVGISGFPEGVWMEEAEVRLTVGASYQFNATALPEDLGGQYDFIWSVSDDKILSITETGEITALKVGTARVSVSLACLPDATIDAVVKVTAADSSSGGSGGSGSGSRSAPSASVSKRPPSSAPSSRSSAGSGSQAPSGEIIYERALQRQLHALVNAERRANGVAELAWSSQLESAAEIRAVEITVLFSHTRPDGSSWTTVSPLAYGENIAAGFSSPESVMAGWMSSTGHRENILRSSFGTLGAGCVRLNGRLHWVQLFGLGGGGGTPSSPPASSAPPASSPAPASSSPPASQTPVYPTQVVPTPDAVTLNVGESIAISISLLPAGVNVPYTVTWWSDAIGVANVDTAGVITANSSGTVPIHVRVSYDNANAYVEATISVTVL